MTLAVKENLIDTIVSMEVALMLEKEHKNLIRDINRYSKHIMFSNENAEDEGRLKIELSDFWIESTYVNSQNKIQPCYCITKLGCEFLAHKMTGPKGTIFTARYINKFHEMEQALYSKLPVSIPPEKKNYMPLPMKQQPWYKRNTYGIQLVVDNYGSSFKEFYSKFFVWVEGKGYDMKKLNKIFAEQFGRLPVHAGEIIDYFPFLEEKATEYLDMLVAEVRANPWINEYTRKPYYQQYKYYHED